MLPTLDELESVGVTESELRKMQAVLKEFLTSHPPCDDLGLAVSSDLAPVVPAL
jgi:hypothetical protein